MVEAGIMEDHKKNDGFWKGALVGALVMLCGVIIFSSVMNPAGAGITQMWSGASPVTGETRQKLTRLKKLIDSNYLYLDEVTEKQLQDGIYSGYVGALGDPYSEYYNEEDTEKLSESISGEYEGIGVVFSQNINTKVMTAVQVYEKSPAKEAGVQEGDILYKIDGRDVSGKELSDVVQDIRGVENTTVELTVLRGEDRKEVVMEVERRKIQVETVEYEMKAQQIGYVRITQFDEVTYKQFEKAIEELEAQGMKGMVVDLRSNPGGSLSIVSQMLDLLLPEGTIVSTRTKDGKKEVLTSDEEHQFTKPMAVLVDGYSASASEIFAGAIQDYGLGPIVGTTTYGKGIVQQIVDLGDGTSIKLTIAEYFTPKGRNIHKKGIEPDVKVEYTKSEEEPDADNQLDAALQEVQKKCNK